MLFLEKCRESVISAVPVVLLVLLLHFTVAPLGDALPRFLAGAVLFVLGLGLFLVGADIGVLPVGQKVGSALTAKRNLALMLAVGFTVGFIITVAEPDVQVLAAQVDDPELQEDWQRLQCSDHFYYMCTKAAADGNVHKYFSPYKAPADAYVNFMNVLADFRIRLLAKVGQ